MSAVIIFVILASGYIFCKLYLPLRYKIVRLTGYKYYFEISFIGLKIFLISIFLYWLYTLSAVDFEFLFIDSINYLLNETICNVYCIAISKVTIAIFIIMFFLTIPYPWLHGIYLSKNLPKALQIIIEASIENRFEKKIWLAFQNDFLISVTLTSGKVYIGWVMETPDPTKETKYLSILPRYSGCRSLNDCELVIHNDYTEIYKKMVSEGGDFSKLDKGNLEIVLLCSHIQSLNIFNIEIYNEFNKQSEENQESGEKQEKS